jgi:hypothetical protein
MKNNALQKIALFSAILALVLAGLPWALGRNGARPPDAKDAAGAMAAMAEAATKGAEILEAKAAAARPRVQAKKEALQEATETRIASSITLDGLPVPMAAEFNAMAAYITALEMQLEIETQRGDMWRDAAMAQLELVTTLREHQNNLIKNERRRALKWGAAGGAAAVILLVALL